MGYTSLTAQALTAPPFLLAFLTVLLTAKLSDIYAARSPFLIAHALLGATGYALAAYGGAHGWSTTTRYLCIFPACCALFSAVTVIITWTINNQESHAKRGVAMTLLNSFGQMGPLLGTRLYPEADAPFFVPGMVACAGAMVGVGVLAVGLRVVLARENARRRMEMEGDGGGDELLEREELGKETGKERARAKGRDREREVEGFVYIL
ncbi:hypothetical protein MRB53_037804 [Persea americana]|nr:hypothetical protein MRB53_037804 [Persea americana]